MVMNVISSNLGAKFIEGTELPVPTPIIPLVCLNVYESENWVFSVLLFF